MTGIFDGMAGVLNTVFGAPVTITPQGSAPATLAGVFRELPIEQETGDGRMIVTVTPTLRVPKDVIAQLAVGDLVAPSLTPGRTFTVLQWVPSPSAAADAFITYLLEEVRA